MAVITVQSEKIIARPIAVVQSQFVDMQRHATTGVHADLAVSNVRAQEGGCRFTGRRRVFGFVQEDEMEVIRDVAGNSTLRSISGSNVGLLISQQFKSVNADCTRLHITVDMPVRGALVLLTPLLRLALKRDLEVALEEDRRDLEERGYEIAS